MKSISAVVLTLALFMTACAGTQVKTAQTEKCDKQSEQQVACDNRSPAHESREYGGSRRP